MPSYTFPTAAELKEVEQELMPRLIADRPCFELLPVENSDFPIIMWEQQDNFLGLQQVRGLGGAPNRVKKTGGKKFIMEPGVYGEFEMIDETELTLRRQYGSFNATINISDLVIRIQNKLLGRRLDRIETIIWDLLVDGIFSVAHSEGGIMHTDQFPIQKFTSVVPWGTVATATPLADFRQVKLLSRGKGVNFGGVAKAYANQTTVNNMLSNTNAADLYGRRTAGLGTFNSLDQINTLYSGDDLPTLVVYDQGYLDDDGVFQLYIPNGKVIVAGKRPSGVAVGSYKMTRNANNADLGPGPYTRVIDNAERAVPRTVEVHDGHNGGPCIEFPGSIVVMTVA